MLTGTHPARRIVVVVLVVTLGVAAVVTSAVLWHSSASRSTRSPVTAPIESSAAQQAPPPPTASAVIEPVAASVIPVAFARTVAVALLGWDTTVPVAREEYVQRIVAVGDPSGVETPGLVTDMSAYLPSDAAWVHLTEYATRQWLQVTSAVVPDQWASVLAATPPGVLAEGTTAVTITGTRHRAGVWEGDRVADRFPVAFTVFVVCEPTYPTCRLLRLGRLDHPMR